MLNQAKLKGLIPDSIIAQIPEAATKFNITTNLRLAHFLAQCAHESNNFTILRENLNYSEDRLKVVFKKYFPNDLAKSYAHQPEKIGSRVYASRMGNGNEASKEGYLFRGRGFIQLTGKNNYSQFNDELPENIDVLKNPDLVATTYPLASSGFFFNVNGLWAICDKGANDATVTAVTKKVNNGTLGLQERIGYFNKFYKALTT